MAVTFPSGLLEAFDTAQRAIFRLETRRFYVGDPNYARFVAGEPWQDTASKDHWCDLVRRRTADGVVMRRVHLVRRPLSDYVRFRLQWSNPRNIDAGEDCRIAEGGPWEAPDFWLFDDSAAWLMRYDADGSLIAVDAAPVDVVDRCREWSRQAYDHSVSPAATPRRR